MQFNIVQLLPLHATSPCFHPASPASTSIRPAALDLWFEPFEPFELTCLAAENWAVSKLGCVNLLYHWLQLLLGIFWNALFNSLHLCSSSSPVSMDPSAPRVVAFRVRISGLNSSLRSRCLLARHVRHFFPRWNLISLNITHMRKHKVFLCALSCPPKPEPRTVENKEKKHKTRPALTRKSVIIHDHPMNNWSSNALCSGRKLSPATQVGSLNVSFGLEP